MVRVVAIDATSLSSKIRLWGVAISGIGEGKGRVGFIVGGWR